MTLYYFSNRKHWLLKTQIKQQITTLFTILWAFLRICNLLARLAQSNYFLLSARNAITDTWLLCFAQSKAVLEWRSLASTSALLSTRYETTSSWSFIAAQMSGVCPDLFRVSILALFSRRYWTVSNSPRLAAEWSPLEMSCPPFSMRYFTITNWVAKWRGDSPSLSTSLISRKE